MSTALTLVQPERPSTLAAVQDTMEALKAIRTFLEGEFKANMDFGVIPGTAKPTLLLPGAQKAMMYFNVAPQREVERVELGAGHLEVLATTRLVSRSTGQIVGEGSGSCSSMEKKYRWRNASLTCPECGKETVFRSKQPGGGHYCWVKKEGCGAQFREGDPAIADQKPGQVDNPDIYDLRNTILKMAIKRADVSAAMSLACLSERFTQDLEDTFSLVTPEPPPAPEPLPARKPEPTMAEMNRASHQYRRGGPHATQPKEAPPGWGSNGNGHAAPAAPVVEGPPKRGSQLWKWASLIERERGRGIMAYLEQYGNSRGWGTRLTAWSDAAVREAYTDALAELEVIYDPHADGGDDYDSDEHERDYN